MLGKEVVHLILKIHIQDEKNVHKDFTRRKIVQFTAEIRHYSQLTKIKAFVGKDFRIPTIEVVLGIEQQCYCTNNLCCFSY